MHPHKTNAIINQMRSTICHVLQIKLPFNQLTATVTIQTKHLNMTMLVISPRKIGRSNQAAIAKCLNIGPSIYSNANIINESAIHYHHELCMIRSLGPAHRNPRMVLISPPLF
jgi:hypothetical protein